MAQSPIKADAIPVPELDAGVLQLDAGWLREDAGKIRTHGADIKSTWAGLAAVYHAPEDATLLSAMDPVAVNTDAFATDTEQVASILSTFAAEAGPLVDTLRSTQASASAFGAKVASNDKWDHDGDLVNQNNALVHTVNTTIVAFQAAERKAANAIETLIGGHTFHAVDPNSATQDKYAYGYSSIPDNAKTPWGADVSKKDGCLKSSLTHVGHFFVGVGEGLWGMVKGAGVLVWDAVGGGGWDKFKQAWEGIGFLATLVVPGGTAAGMAIWGPKGYTQRLEAMGKGLVDWDEWKTDPAKAAGNTVANIGTLFIPGAGEAGAVADGAKGAELAAKAGEVADVAGDAGKASTGLARAGELTKAGLQTFSKLTDPFHYVSQLPKIVDVAKGLGIKIPDLGSLVGHGGADLSHVGSEASHVGSEASHVATHEPALAGAGHDVGPGAGHDVGTGAGHDAGTGSTHDAGTGAGHDAGTGSTHDAGTGSTHDAGTGSTHDAGTGSHDSHTGQHEWHDESGKRHFEGDPPNTSRDVNGALHDSAGNFTHDPNAHTNIDVHAVTGDSHVITAHDPAYHAQVADRSATQAEHTSDLAARNTVLERLDKQGVHVDAHDLSGSRYEDTISKLRLTEHDPAVLRDLRELRATSQNETQSLAALKAQSEHLGMTAAHDTITAGGGHVIVGEDAARAGRPGELDTVGLSHDGHTLTVVEAKGGSGTLGSRMVGDVRAQQGSTAYLNDLLHRDPRLADYLHEHPDLATRLAHGDVRLEYKLVEAKASGAVKVTDFHLDGDGLHLGDLGPRDGATHLTTHADATAAHPAEPGHSGTPHPGPTSTAGDHASAAATDAPAHAGTDAAPVHTAQHAAPQPVRLADGSTHEVAFSNAHLHEVSSSGPALTDALARHDLTPAQLGDLIRTPHADLTPHQVDVLQDVRQSVPGIDVGEPMSKALNGPSGDALLEHRVSYPENSVQGFVARAGDLADVHGVADQRDALALTYLDRHGDPAFPADASHAYSMRFTTADPAVPGVPLSRDLGGTYDAPPPYTGNGFTASEHHLVPEYRYDRPVQAQPGAEMWRVNADGTEQLAGVLNDDGVWVQVG